MESSLLYPRWNSVSFTCRLPIWYFYVQISPWPVRGYISRYMICQKKMTEKLVLNPRFRLSRHVSKLWMSSIGFGGGPTSFGTMARRHRSPPLHTCFGTLAGLVFGSFVMEQFGYPPKLVRESPPKNRIQQFRFRNYSDIPMIYPPWN